MINISTKLDPCIIVFLSSEKKKMLLSEKISVYQIWFQFPLSKNHCLAFGTWSFFFFSFFDHEQMFVICIMFECRDFQGNSIRLIKRDLVLEF